MLKSQKIIFGIFLLYRFEKIAYFIVNYKRVLFMKNRRDFIKLSALGGVAVLTNSCLTSKNENKIRQTSQKKIIKPIVVSTWNHGMEANVSAWKILSKGGSSLDAVEAGVRVTESDPNNSTS